MNNERLRQLEKYYAEDPGDPFNLYALAIEYMKTDPGKSLECFEKLLSRHAAYLPTYYHAARLYQERGEKEKAEKTYLSGMALAGSQHDVKALRELRSAYDEMMFE